MSRLLPLLATLVGLTALSWLAAANPEPSWQEQEARWLSNIRQLTFDVEDPRAGARYFVAAGEAYFSPDQQEIIFQAIRGPNPFYQIYTMRLDDGIPRLVSTGRGRCTCAFYHPSGRKIIFASSHLDPDVLETEAAERRRLEEARRNPAKRRRRYEWTFDPHMEIFEANRDGSNLRNLTNSPGYDAECAYSPDGSKIVFCSTRDGDPDLYIMDADGSNVRQLTNAPGYDGGPFFSPEGKRIIFRSDRDREGYLQIYVINVDGSGERKLTNLPGVAWAPYWHPNGKHVVFAYADYSNPRRRPNFDLYVLNVETGAMARVTYAPAADVLPVFSPDGKKLMWTSKGRNGTVESQLFLADFNDSLLP